MPDTDGNLLLDADGNELLNTDGTEACVCCCACPTDAPSAVVLTGHVYWFDGAVVQVDEDFSATLNEGDACIYIGDTTTSGGTFLEFIYRLLSDPCRWDLVEDALTDATTPSDRTGPTPITGAMPDINWTDGTNIVNFTFLVIS